jgi:hypothetical protein
MTTQDLRIQFRRETGQYAPIDDYDPHIRSSISEKDYIKWLEEKLVDDENYINSIDKSIDQFLNMRK